MQRSFGGTLYNDHRNYSQALGIEKSRHIFTFIDSFIYIHTPTVFIKKVVTSSCDIDIRFTTVAN